MLIEKDINKILNQLAKGSSIKIPFEDLDIMISIVDQSSKLCLSSLVFDGGNYIPSSVRECLSHQSPFFHPSILTFLTVDEQNFQIKVNYLGQVEILTHPHFKEILEEFGAIADKWRHYLEDHGKNDLVYVRTK